MDSIIFQVGHWGNALGEIVERTWQPQQSAEKGHPGRFQPRPRDSKLRPRPPKQGILPILVRAKHHVLHAASFSNGLLGSTTDRGDESGRMPLCVLPLDRVKRGNPAATCSIWWGWAWI